MVDLEGCLVKANCLVAFKPVINLQQRDEIEIKSNMAQIINIGFYLLLLAPSGALVVIMVY